MHGSVVLTDVFTLLILLIHLTADFFISFFGQSVRGSPGFSWSEPGPVGRTLISFGPCGTRADRLRAGGMGGIRSGQPLDGLYTFEVRVEFDRVNH
jgi:hypothetical protein